MTLSVGILESADILLLLSLLALGLFLFALKFNGPGITIQIIFELVI
ncbi:MAG: hypothetical protein N0E48_04930 [Candidatus Thiodiazotropha endolucinida]|nr:hypothetical protein [Candidatus Thiodiazotropha taylori]MCW4342692.1 hypothetical protein [Candidatus Thiodiazotropha endolucinida]